MDGTPFGRYRLVELLGRGGMGEVWRAHDTATDRIVAIKLLPAFLSDDEEFQQRFRREAHAAARLNNPHVIPIHNYGEIDGQLYVDMRLIEGRDLQTILADGPLDPVRAVRIIEQVANALQAAHRVGLLHRDIKPSNILLDHDDFAYLIDFGIARAIEETRMTKSGDTIGTFQYIAPERLDATAHEDARADIYSLACVLYESLTGQPPFPGSSAAHLITAHLNTPPPRPSTTQPDVPAEVDDVIATGMAKDPAQRYATTVELANAARDAVTDRIHTPTAGAAQPATMLAPDPRLPATAYASSTAPTQFGAPADTSSPPAPPAADGRNQRRRRIAMVGGAVATAAVVVVLVIAFTNLGSSKPPDNPKPVAVPNTGPFTGVYRADFGPSATNGKPDDGGTPSTGQWSVRSVCRQTGCIATATANGGPTLQSSFVFDDFGGQWHAVGAYPVASPPPGVSGFDGCQFPAEYWTVITVQQRPDGTVAGQYRATGPPECETERTVTFTRIGDVDVNTLPDPAGLPAPVGSPASAFHGRYHATQTPLDIHKTGTWEPIVATDCLRTGERCVSKVGYDVYHFSNGKWVFNLDTKRTCEKSETRDATNFYWEFPLPQPPQDPITLLTGHGHKQVSGTDSCAGSYDENVKFERTGD
ncbi:serine/threonine protein kinase [Mycobacterium ahvazicum]|uniref:non-specific serine/threonine protein kinase n=1 Tax=Mycobacterium ahvazicum TaxID=1964395 RepID=A0A2K4YE97_9MYCO|nr:serine/threonine-protein kinase [Mycobacterium ahvazicum]SOX55109.1 serine/threonine protein kinase [Mycobacterium ahvazicum]